MSYSSGSINQFGQSNLIQERNIAISPMENTMQAFIEGKDEDTINAVVTDQDNNIYVTGYIDDQDINNADVFVSKFGSNGSLIWSKV
ncbi:MAG: SBBP repeat-containing protein, partial [Candidatus Kariarchaeaceae archaeon]